MTWSTHKVFNQVPILEDVNLYGMDRALQEGVQRLSGDHYQADLMEYGQRAGSSHVRELAEKANKHPPVLDVWDAQGHRVDKVGFHPAWHALMNMAFSSGMHCSAWSDAPHAHVGRAGHYLLHGQIEAGSLCPLTMTSAAIPLLQREVRFDGLVRRLKTRLYDKRDMPWPKKTSVMIGMGLTEKQGGSDLRSNCTQARAADGQTCAILGDAAAQQYWLTGHKWFFSAPTSDAHLVLAQYQGELSCFFVPRWLDVGVRNGVLIQRLKDKLGNHSNASAEVEFQDALGVMLGKPGRGIATLIEMASYTRLDCVLGSTALLRQAVAQAIHHARYRQAFGQSLAQQPLMQAVLVDLALESEAATVLALHLADAFDRADELALAWRRVLTPAAKFWICKRSIQAVAECMEVLGGNGYIETGPMARLYRETPVNSIWEGSGNIMCLDVLRALGNDSDLASLLFDALADVTAQDAMLAQVSADLLAAARMPADTLYARARHITGQLVLLTQAVLLRRHAPQDVADAFIATRFAPDSGVFGGTVSTMDPSIMLERAWPA